MLMHFQSVENFIKTEVLCWSCFGTSGQWIMYSVYSLGKLYKSKSRLCYQLNWNFDWKLKYTKDFFQKNKFMEQNKVCLQFYAFNKKQISNGLFNWLSVQFNSVHSLLLFPCIRYQVGCNRHFNDKNNKANITIITVCSGWHRSFIPRHC